MNPDFLHQSQELRKRATQFLADKKVVDVLREFGDVHYFGSYELGLMNRQDIDIVLVVEKLSFAVASNLSAKLNKLGFNKFWIFDNSDKGCQEDPKHIVCEASFGSYHHQVPAQDRWDVGISICEQSELESALKLTNEVKAKIKEQPELKELVINLKYQLAKKHGEHTYRGKAVYDAILKYNAKTVEEIENLETNNY